MRIASPAARASFSKIRTPGIEVRAFATAAPLIAPDAETYWLPAAYPEGLGDSLEGRGAVDKGAAEHHGSKRAVAIW